MTKAMQAPSLYIARNNLARCDGVPKIYCLGKRCILLGFVGYLPGGKNNHAFHYMFWLSMNIWVGTLFNNWNKPIVGPQLSISNKFYVRIW